MKFQCRSTWQGVVETDCSGSDSAGKGKLLGVSAAASGEARARSIIVWATGSVGGRRTLIGASMKRSTIRPPEVLGLPAQSGGRFVEHGPEDADLLHRLDKVGEADRLDHVGIHPEGVA